MQFTLPETILVYVPAVDAEVEVLTAGVTEEQVLAMLTHGLKQKLTDSAAGKPEKAGELVAKRLLTVWDASGNRGPKADPIMVETRKLVIENAGQLKVVKKQVPAKMADFAEWYASQVLGGTPETDLKIRAAISTKAESIVASRGLEITLD